MQITMRKGLLAAGVLSSAMALPAWAAQDAVIAVASNFTTLDPYDANDTLSQAVAKSFYQGLFGFDKEMKLTNVLAESYQFLDRIEIEAEVAGVAHKGEAFEIGFLVAPLVALGPFRRTQQAHLLVIANGRHLDAGVSGEITDRIHSRSSYL